MPSQAVGRRFLPLPYPSCVRRSWPRLLYGFRKTKNPLQVGDIIYAFPSTSHQAPHIVCSLTSSRPSSSRVAPLDALTGPVLANRDKWRSNNGRVSARQLNRERGTVSPPVPRLRSNNAAGVQSSRRNVKQQIWGRSIIALINTVGRQ